MHTLLVPGQAGGTRNNSQTSNDKCNGAGSCLGTPCQAPSPEVVSDSLAFWENDMVLIYANGTVNWGIDLFLVKIQPVAESLNDVYLSITGRRADRSGLNYWYADYLNVCSDDANCDVSTASTLVNQAVLDQVVVKIQYSYDNQEGTWGGLVGEFTYCEAKAMGY